MVDPNLYICIYFSCHEQCCLFEFPNLAVILKCSCRFINSIPYSMVDPSYPFVSVLMALVFKRNSLHIPNTNIFSLSNTNTFSIPILHRVLPLKHFHPFTPINRCTMMTAEGQSSSHCKGKEIVSDAPATHDVGEKVVYSESDHSNEEEARRAPNSKCAPFINFWYDTHTYFPKFPDNYTSLPPGRVWLTLCLCNIDVSWASLASSIPDLVIHHGTSLPMPILFEFGSGTTLG